MKYLITNFLNEKEKNKIKERGLYCYDLRLSDMKNEIATIEKNVLVNKVGSIITNEEIIFEEKLEKDFMYYTFFVENNEQVDRIEELINFKIKDVLNSKINILDSGYRNNEPVILVEKMSKYGKEYIIGFNYKIIENEIEWGYGYYYGINQKKAKEDFKKILNGGYLVDTFNINKKNKEKER